MPEQPKCQICGEPMPPGEEMFKYHGYNGDCPKPPLPNRRFRKKPVVIEAIQLRWSTWNEMCEFLGGIISEDNPARNIPADEASDTCGEQGPNYIALTIPTLEGNHTALHGDWIIKGVKGEFYPCKPDIFARTYDIESATSSPIPTAKENPEGLHQRYKVTKADGTPVDPNAVYFVLRLDHDGDDPKHIAACRAAAMAYVQHAPEHLRKVAEDLLELLRRI